VRRRDMERLAEFAPRAFGASNGWTTPVPRNTIMLTAVWPSGASFIGSTDDWLRLVFIHEFTPIVWINRGAAPRGGATPSVASPDRQETRSAACRQRRGAGAHNVWDAARRHRETAHGHIGIGSDGKPVARRNF